MNSKKGLTVLLTTLLSSAIVFSGCSSNTTKSGSSSSESPKNTASSTAAAVKSDLKPYEVVMVYPDSTQRDLEKVQNAMNEYLKSTYPEMNMTVKLNPVDWGAWGDKTNLMFASGEKFDTIFTANWLGFESQVNKGALLPLDDLLKQYGPDIEKVEKDYHSGATRGGKIYGIHTHQELGGSQGIVVRKDLAEKYHFDLAALAKSRKMEDLEPMLKTIKENEPGITPMVGLPLPLEAYFKSGKMEMILDPVGLVRSNKDFKAVSYYDTDEYMNLARLTHSWFKQGYINKDASTSVQSNNDGWSKMKTGNAFAIAGADMEIVSDNSVPAPMPIRSKQVGMDLIQIPFNIDSLRTRKLADTTQAISKNSEDPARAMMLLNLFFKDAKLLSLFNYGIEGTHYVLKNGQVDLPEGKTTDNVGFYHDNQWQIGNQMLNYTRVGEDPKKYENYEKFNKDVAADPSIIFGFIFDSEPVKNELIAIENVRKTYDAGLNSGTLDPDVEVPKLTSKLKAAGIDKVVAEVQKQLDEWRKANGK
ncbi:ABC transporter substrate-binding protein [Paenibacillus hexagrammi]|uniref:ABC transporter substrate-binding protein n=1 Tax=Paenibacillus hexagrammi TaxID=2908839 RepID=A0ABY3SED4_9BACL|nr:ABC transporter substrate-binding protein [Paenibacillus sp. YPD9-1]UJF31830.1 ABC transporter substrate-binding protein [Paenibacillus sp. YPD9-1]